MMLYEVPKRPMNLARETSKRRKLIAYSLGPLGLLELKTV